MTSAWPSIYRLFSPLHYNSELLLVPSPLVPVAVVQSPSRVWFYAAPGTTAHQASLSFTISWCLLNSRSWSQWCYPTISSSVIPFSSRLQPFTASGYFLMSQLFESSGQSTGASAQASVFPMNVQNWFCLGLTAWIPLQSKGLSWVFSNTTVEKHQFFGAQSSFLSNSHIHTWLLVKPLLWLDRRTFVSRVMSLPFKMLSLSYLFFQGAGVL